MLHIIKWLVVLLLPKTLLESHRSGSPYYFYLQQNIPPPKFQDLIWYHMSWCDAQVLKESTQSSPYFPIQQNHPLSKFRTYPVDKCQWNGTLFQYPKPHNLHKTLATNHGERLVILIAWSIWTHFFLDTNTCTIIVIANRWGVWHGNFVKLDMHIYLLNIL